MISCDPEVCTYIYTQRSQRITVIINLIGFFGGLTVLLRLLVPPSVKLTVWLRHYFSRRLHSQACKCASKIGRYMGKTTCYSRYSFTGSSPFADRLSSTKCNDTQCFREKIGGNSQSNTSHTHLCHSINFFISGCLNLRWLGRTDLHEERRIS